MGIEAKLGRLERQFRTYETDEEIQQEIKRKLMLERLSDAELTRIVEGD